MASGKTPFKIKAGNASDKKVEIESTVDFYFWGYLPGNSTIDLEDHGNELGLEHPSFVTIEQKTSWKNLLYTIITLGLYCPVDYKISLLISKGPK